MIKNKKFLCFYSFVLAFSISTNNAVAAIARLNKGARTIRDEKLSRALPKKIKAAKVRKTSPLLAQIQPAQDFVVVLKKPLKVKR
jgi:hypothetical protein